MKVSAIFRNLICQSDHGIPSSVIHLTLKPEFINCIIQQLNIIRVRIESHIIGHINNRGIRINITISFLPCPILYPILITHRNPHTDRCFFVDSFFRRCRYVIEIVVASYRFICTRHKTQTDQRYNNNFFHGRFILIPIRTNRQAEQCSRKPGVLCTTSGREPKRRSPVPVAKHRFRTRDRTASL